MKRLARRPLLFSLAAILIMTLLPHAILVLIRVLFGERLAGEEAMVHTLVYLLDLGVILALAAVLRGRLHGGFSFGVRKGLLRRSLLLCLPMLVESVYSVGLYIQEGCPGIAFRDLVPAVFRALQAGITEETVFRGLILGNLMYQWRGKPNRIRDAVLVSAVLFSLSHLINLARGQELLTTVMQLGYTLAVGCLTGVAYVRTRNILGPILIHCLQDLITLGLESALSGSVEMPMAAAAVILSVKTVTYVAAVGFAMVMVRSSQHAKILALWTEPEENK